MQQHVRMALNDPRHQGEARQVQRYARPGQAYLGGGAGGRYLIVFHQHGPALVQVLPVEYGGGP